LAEGGRSGEGKKGVNKQNHNLDGRIEGWKGNNKQNDHATEWWLLLRLRVDGKRARQEREGA
jgi:hypothetical protein